MSDEQQYQELGQNFVDQQNAFPDRFVRDQLRNDLLYHYATGRPTSFQQQEPPVTAPPARPRLSRREWRDRLLGLLTLVMIVYFIVKIF